jgi:predicted nucleic acid-binding Zn ribbon protein
MPVRFRKTILIIGIVLALVAIWIYLYYGRAPKSH